MDREELLALLADVESDRSERTSSTAKTDKFGEAICAFANDMPQNRRPGYLFIGANPDGTASGAMIDEDLLEKLAHIRSNGNVQPLPSMSVQKHHLGGGDMAVIEVHPSDLPPVRYKGVVWIRVGPTRRQAHEHEERMLSERRASLARTWDARPCRAATLDNLVLDLFAVSYRPNAIAKDVIAENGRPIAEQLASLRFYDLGAACPTNAATLVFGSDPTFFHAGAYVQYVRYAGLDPSADVSVERRYSGDLLTVMRGLDNLANELAEARPVREGSELAERIVYDYPPRALHEALMNGVIHRDYESNTPLMVSQFVDRIEIQNPGGLYGELTPARVPGGTAYRNPVLAECARVLGFVNRFGRGFYVIRDELRRNGSPPEDLVLSEPTHVLVTMRKRP